MHTTPQLFDMTFTRHDRSVFNVVARTAEQVQTLVRMVTEQVNGFVEFDSGLVFTPQEVAAFTVTRHERSTR